jgi:hypothetical protein
MACELNYTLVGLTGDCSNTNQGAFKIEIDGTAPPYSIEWIRPRTDTVVLGAGVTTYTETSLSGGSYVFTIIDSCSDPSNVEQLVQIHVSSGFCTSVSSVSNTVCNGENGSITATTTYDYGNYKWYLYNNLGFISEGVTNDDIDPHGVIFTDLKPDIYYVKAVDDGGCTGITNSVIIQSSNTLTYDVYTIDNSSCAPQTFDPQGKIFITNLKGKQPYTYSWKKDGVDLYDTTSSLTGLSEGTYVVTVTDSSGCSLQKQTILKKASPIGQVAIDITPPTCFESDGSVCIFISGGTPPYSYLLSNFDKGVTFGTQIIFEDLHGGSYSYTITDSGLCQYTGNFTIAAPKSFQIVDIGKTDSECGNNQGSFNFNVAGGQIPYSFTVKSLTVGVNYDKTVATTLVPYEFKNLAAGLYEITIKDKGDCVYTITKEILDISDVGFDFTYTDTTCGFENGSVTMNVTKGDGPFTYTIAKNDGSYVDNDTAIPEFTKTFENLSGGAYVLTLKDEDLVCKVQKAVFIGMSDGFDVTLCPVNATECDNGSIDLLIGNGKPPFTITWSDNVNGQTGYNLTNLSAGTYTVTVTDSTGCLTEESIVLEGGICPVISYQVYELCNDDFKNSSQLLKKTPLIMVKEGFADLTYGDENCVLNKAVFEAVTVLSGITATSNFYTGYTLNDVPSDSLFSGTVKNMLLNYDGIGSVEIDISKNKIIINTDCESNVSLLDAKLQVYLKIYYDVSCVTCSV